MKGLQSRDSTRREAQCSTPLGFHSDSGKSMLGVAAGCEFGHLILGETFRVASIVPVTDEPPALPVETEQADAHLIGNRWRDPTLIQAACGPTDLPEGVIWIFPHRGIFLRHRLE